MFQRIFAVLLMIIIIAPFAHASDLTTYFTNNEGKDISGSVQWFIKESGSNPEEITSKCTNLPDLELKLPNGQKTPAICKVKYLSDIFREATSYELYAKFVSPSITLVSETTPYKTNIKLSTTSAGDCSSCGTGYLGLNPCDIGECLSIPPEGSCAFLADNEGDSEKCVSCKDNFASCEEYPSEICLGDPCKLGPCTSYIDEKGQEKCVTKKQLKIAVMPMVGKVTVAFTAATCDSTRLYNLKLSEARKHSLNPLWTLFRKSFPATLIRKLSI
jgi:hypothetical protein